VCSAKNDDGLTGGTQQSDVTVEFCEFDSNGNTNASASSPTHNIYIYGGTFAMRYCYLHDSAQSPEFSCPRPDRHARIQLVRPREILRGRFDDR